MSLAKLAERHPRNHEELWIVSYADMMTLLFGFFVILFSFTQVDEKRLQEFGKQVANELNNGKTMAEAGDEDPSKLSDRRIRALKVLISMVAPGDSLEMAVEKIESLAAANSGDEAARKVVAEGLAAELGKMQASLGRGKNETEDVVELSLPATTLFAAGDDHLRPEAVVKLKDLARTLAKLPGVNGIEVVGHTDSEAPTAKGKFQTNWAISSARAGAVAELLAQGGVARKSLAVRGVADLQPLFPERSPDGVVNRANQAKNRRVSIIVKKAVTPKPAG